MLKYAEPDVDLVAMARDWHNHGNEWDKQLPNVGERGIRALYEKFKAEGLL